MPSPAALSACASDGVGVASSDGVGVVSSEDVGAVSDDANSPQPPDAGGGSFSGSGAAAPPKRLPTNPGPS